MFGLADAGSKPLSCAKVKRREECQPRDGAEPYVRRITLPAGVIAGENGRV